MFVLCCWRPSSLRAIFASCFVCLEKPITFHRFHALQVRFFSTCFFLIFLFSGLSFSQAQTKKPQIETNKKNQLLELVKKAVLRAGSSVTMEAGVDLGPIPANSSVQLYVELENPTGRSYVISEVSSGCSCLRSNMRGDVAANAVTPIELFLKTQAKASTIEHKQYLKFREEASEVEGFNLVVSYQLAGLLSFKQDSHYERVALASVQKGVTFRVPFLLSSPVEARKIKVSLTEGLEKSRGRIVTEGESQFVEVAYKADGESLPGTITLEDMSAGAVARIPVFVQVEAPVTIAPRTPRFVWSEDRGAFIASSIVRLSEGDIEGGRAIAVRTWLPDAGKAELVTKVQKLNDKTARLEHVLKVDGGRRFRPESDANFNRRIALEVRGAKTYVEELSFELVH